jgi:hypothetical protein
LAVLVEGLLQLDGGDRDVVVERHVELVHLDAADKRGGCQGSRGPV